MIPPKFSNRKVSPPIYDSTALLPYEPERGPLVSANAELNAILGYCGEYFGCGDFIRCGVHG